jgi:hypothetical protein
VAVRRARRSHRVVHRALTDYLRRGLTSCEIQSSASHSA